VPNVTVRDSGQRRDQGREPLAGIDQRLELAVQIECPHPDRADLADLRPPGRETRGLEIDNYKRRLLERDLLAPRRCERDRAAAPAEPCVTPDDVLEEAARETFRRVPEREQVPRRVLGRHRPVPLLDKLDQPVGGIERQLHAGSLGEHVFAWQISFAKGQALPGGNLTPV
jgi:hypothetical protein